MLTVGNDLVRHQLHQQRNKYLMIGGLLIAFAILLLGSLPFATFSMVVFFGLLLMLAAFLHMIAAFLFFEGGIRVLWLTFAIAYFVAGSIVFQHPWSTAQFLTQLLGGSFCDCWRITHDQSMALSSVSRMVLDFNIRILNHIDRSPDFSHTTCGCMVIGVMFCD